MQASLFFPATFASVFVYFLLSACHENSTKKPQVNTIYSAVDPLKVITEKRLDKNKIEILIDKSDYKLSLLIGNDTIKSYKSVFGNNSLNDKLQQGDGCTPEGIFSVRDLYPHKSWEKFIWIDYPNSESWKKHNEAKRLKKISASANIGGEVGIHGVPKGFDSMIDNGTNWTLGCVSLKNSDINEIYALVKKGTKIVIRQ